MKRGLAVFLMVVLMLPFSYSISLKELISKYSFFSSTSQMSVTGYNDYMADKDGNGLNDTLVFELETNSIKGNYTFVVNLFDKNGILANETKTSLNAGVNKVNLTFDSSLLSQNQFNYSIKVYNSTYSLNYRKDNILTNYYAGYEEGFKLIGVKDFKSGNSLMLNFTINSTLAGNFKAKAFLSYNNSIIYAADDKEITSSVQGILINFDNETIKRTHYSGSFKISSFIIGNKKFATDFFTDSYDFRDFAASSYISGFSDSATDTDNNDKNDALRINVNAKILEDGGYMILLSLYDLFGNIIGTKNISLQLDSGDNSVSFDFNGSRIFDRKLNGPFIVKNAELYENGALADRLANAYTTKNYNFNDFENKNLPDLAVNISASDGYHYGINNITLSITVKNVGSKHAFGIFTAIFDNLTFSKSNMTNILKAGSSSIYEIEFTNITDFEIMAIADLNDFVEELNESNNAEKVLIKLNKKPDLAAVKNVTVNETDKIMVNLSAYDPNDDNLSYSVNFSKFKKDINLFEWKTTTMDSGNYTVAAIASDGYLNGSAIFEIHVVDVPEIDADNDGVNDTFDNVVGDEKSINTSTINLTFFIDESKNISRIFNETGKVNIFDGNLAIAEFDFDFSKYKLNLSNLTINKQGSNLTGALVFKGLNLPEGATKTLYVDRLNAGINGLCIKDGEISSISEISGSCDSNDEYKIECDGTLQNGYKCAYNSTLNKYKVEGLKHSGLVQLDYSKPTSGSNTGSSSTGGSGAGGSAGGGGIVCISKWQCTEWSKCSNGASARKCNDTNQCPTPTGKPSELQQCSENTGNLNLSANQKYLEAIYQFRRDLQFRKNLQRLNQSGKLAGISGAVVKSLPATKPRFAISIIAAVVVLATGLYVSRNKHRLLPKIFK